MITFEGFDDMFVRILKNGDILRECHAAEVPFPPFILKSEMDSEIVHPYFDQDRKTWSFSVGLMSKFADLTPWTHFVSESNNGVSANLNINCPKDTTITWAKDPAKE